MVKSAEKLNRLYFYVQILIFCKLTTVDMYSEQNGAVKCLLS